MDSIPNVTGLEEWEVGVLQELRLLKQEGLLEPVLDAVASCLGVLYQREQYPAQRKKQKEKPAAPSGPMAKKLAKLRPDLERREIEALIAANTIAGQMLSKSKYTRKEILWVIAEEVAGKRLVARAGRCSTYLRRGNVFGPFQGGLPTLGKDR